MPGGLLMESMICCLVYRTMTAQQVPVVSCPSRAERYRPKLPWLAASCAGVCEILVSSRRPCSCLVHTHAIDGQQRR